MSSNFMKFDDGVSAVMLNGGRTYHRLIPGNEGDHAVQWFIHDQSMFARHGLEQGIPPGWTDLILCSLQRVNPFIPVLQSFSTHNLNATPKLALHHRKTKPVQSGHPHHRFLDILSPFVEPLHYLLLLPYENLGWSPERCTIASPSHPSCKFSQMRHYHIQYFINAATMSSFSQLTGEWLVNAWSVIEEMRLTYIHLNQHSVDGEAEESSEDHEAVNSYHSDGDSAPVDDIHLPASFIHSPAWTAANIADCLALCKALGPVSLFITHTCNPEWLEMFSQLKPGQTANDCPDIVIHVYQQHFQAFIDELKKCLGGVKYIITVQEFQKCGLSHPHVAICLKEMPKLLHEIDIFISCKSPRTEGSLHVAVLKHMTHCHNPQKKYH
ncbi:hypothetical protein D9758_015855 [Tetrapyrgos nigripes]|uniref:Helitron helicase-like domain-containing protein n=1 Tax=Tetrapyrgos nigripes TaxID=182062 RepID=A0A8H5C7Y0_9AGAR|nr:hypothetical protein D9758_015855 [Tetrapyrgos nigripes]